MKRERTKFEEKRKRIEYEGCEGCNFMYKNTCFLQYHSLEGLKKCPCINCVVKIMCDRMCDSRCKIYSDLIAQTHF